MRVPSSLHARGVGWQEGIAEPGAMLGTGSVCARQEKTPPILPFTTPMESDQRLRACRRDAPSANERFCRRPADDVFGMHRFLMFPNGWRPSSSRLRVAAP